MLKAESFGITNILYETVFHKIELIGPSNYS